MENSNVVFEGEIQASVEAEGRPKLESLDSGEEFSLAHLLEVYKLIQVEEHEFDGYLFADSADTQIQPIGPKSEPGVPVITWEARARSSFKKIGYART